VKPFEESFLYGVQLYGTYTEGYRSPSIIETLMTGLHPAGVVFPFLPNPDLVPETARTIEFGVNVKRDNVFQTGDGVRIKAAWFRNNVDDYIGLAYLSPYDPTSGCPFAPVAWAIPICVQYQNFDKVRIEGVELEALYDTGWMFAGVQGSAISGQDLSTTPSSQLASIPPDQVTGRVGVRLLDQKLTIGGELQMVMPYKVGNYSTDPTLQDSIIDGYELLNLFASYAPNDNLRFDVRLENILDVAYGNYINVAAGSPILEEGFDAKFAATLRFGVDDTVEPAEPAFNKQ